MTREDILAMPAGRELDALVAEKVMGYKYTSDFDRLFKPSTDISAAWEVVEKFNTYRMQKLRDNDHRLVDGKVHQCFLGKNGNCAYGHTAPEAICKAALLAVLEESL
jgi:hypothetical protein